MKKEIVFIDEETLTEYRYADTKPLVDKGIQGGQLCRE